MKPTILDFATGNYFPVSTVEKLKAEMQILTSEIKEMTKSLEVKAKSARKGPLDFVR